MFAQKENVDSEIRPEESGLVVPGANGPLDVLMKKVFRYKMEDSAKKNTTVFSSEINAEPDSSVNYADENVVSPTLKKSVKSQYDLVKTDSLCPDSVGVEEGAALLESIASEKRSATQSGIELNADDSDRAKSQVSHLRTGGVFTEPIETSIIQNVSKLTKNFTLNVNSSVNSLATIQEVVQSVSSGNQTLWLPTIITPSNISNNEDHISEEGKEPTPTTVSQIFLAGTGQHFSSHNNSKMITTKPSHVPNNKFTPKVQILGSITIPKQGTITNSTQSNVKIHGNYLSQSDVSSMNSSTVAPPNKQIISGTVLNPMSNKIHSTHLPARVPSNQVQVKCSSVISSTNIQMKGMSAGSISRPINKVNHVINSKIEGSNPPTVISGQSNHVLSRVLPSPKISLQQTGRVMKSSNIQYNPKLSSGDQQTTNIMHSHKIQAAVPVKIIQQQSLQPSHKGGFKTVQTSRPAIGASKNITYNTINSLPQKTWSQVPNSNQVVNQKPTSTYTKNISGMVNVQKLNSKSTSQKMVLHQSSNQIIMQNPNHVNRLNAQHYQSSDTSGGIRYIQSYVGLDNNNSTPASSNQNLTAQILQSLSQPKIILPSHNLPAAKRTPPARQYTEDAYYFRKSIDQSRQIHGDPNTISSRDDLSGTEERPSVTEDSYPFHYHALQVVLLDHNYASPSQPVTANSVNGCNPVAAITSPINNMILTSPVSPTKVVTLSSNSPVNGTLTVQSPVTSVSVIIPNNASNIQNTTTYQFTVPPPEDDDTASIISSIEGDRDLERSNDRHDSDTETAPEVEEEGKTRCVCEFNHDDGYMICCDRCGEWQHVDCMGIDRQNIPDDYMCDRCEPRLIDRKRARSIQIRKREELTGLGSSGSDSSSGGSISHQQRSKQIVLGLPTAVTRKRPLTVTTYSNTISGVSRTVPAFSTFSPPYDASNPSQLQNKKVPKRPRRIDNGRKGPKRKMPEKRKRKTSEISSYRSKFCGVSAVSHQVNQWVESFELATTNHYSPELRAKIARYCSNKGTNNVANTAVVLSSYLCTTVPHAGSKILIATKDLKENTPIVELRGKYMLSTQHKPQPQLSGRVGSQKPGPFLFFYRLSKDSTQICIDTRTYGNEARFVRRSCKPNSELQHYIHKGALHVYLVTITSIHSNTEISIRHESSGSAQTCACGNAKFCKQTGITSPIHKSDHTTFEAICDRKGRTRLSSSSFSFDQMTSNSPIKYEDVAKQTSPDIENRRVSGSDFTEVPEIMSPEKNVDKVIGFNISPIIDKKCAPEEDKSKIEVSSSPIKKVIDFGKIDIDSKHLIEQEIKKMDDILSTENTSDNVSSEVKEEDEDDEDDNEPLSKMDCKSLPPNSTKVTTPPIVQKSKENEKSKKAPISRRASLHSTRTTRATSTMIAQSTNESADEKSDSQTDSKQTTKEKKKMTREERKMEAIMKAFERMEKAELRRQENKEKQTKRRESDSNPPGINNSICESKDQNDDTIDDSADLSNKRKSRKKGRVRTVSQRSRNRLNSIDSDMVTSGEESTSLLSPSNNSNTPTLDNMSDSINLGSSEHLSYHDRPLSDTSSLQQSVQRLNVGLSSACLLVEAAVGPLESTFKFPKTKKDIMNEWLSKSPERHLSHGMNHSYDYTNTNDNNNTTHSYLSNKSLSDYFMKTTKNLMSLGRETLSAESTPEKCYSSDQIEPENLSTFDSSVGSSLSPTSPQFLLQKGRKNLVDDTNDKKVPKRFRKGFRGLLDERISPVKRALRSTTHLDNDYYGGGFGNMTPPHNDVIVTATTPEIRDAEITIAPQPPQHSAKKRWLRQAISEESDSPTAESPPNEIVTPLKKRRLARESLSLEPPFNNCDETQFTSVGVLKKIDNLSQSERLNIESLDTPKIEIPTRMEAIIEENIAQDDQIETNDEHVLNKLAQEIDHNNEKYFPDSVSESTKESNTIMDIDEESKNSQSCNEISVNKTDEVQTDSTILSDLKINFTNFSRLKRSNDYLDSKDDACIEDVISIDRDFQDSGLREIKSEPVSNIHSAETSGNSSPVIDDIDDIKKRIHSFHTENIQILKIRNKKQPKEKRKLNLTFDLCVLADQTVGVKLKTETEASNEEVSVSESKSRLIDDTQNRETSSEASNLTSDRKSPMKEPESLTSSNVNSPVPSTYQSNNAMSPGEGDKGFMCTPIFTGSFKGEPNVSNSPMPDINAIKNAINITTSLDIGIKTKNLLTSMDEYKNVQEILSHVNQMDSHNSLLLSGVLRDSNHSLNEATSPNKPSFSNSKDPRLNPPPVEKPKPQRRKLSISEYRRRHSMVSNSSTEQDTSCGSTSPGTHNSSSMANPAPISRTASTSDDFSSDLLQNTGTSISLGSFQSLNSDRDECSNLDSNASSTSSPSNRNLQSEIKLPAEITVEGQSPLPIVNISFNSTSPQIRSAR